MEKGTRQGCLLPISSFVAGPRDVWLDPCEVVGAKFQDPNSEITLRSGAVLIVDVLGERAAFGQLCNRIALFQKKKFRIEDLPGAWGSSCHSNSDVSSERKIADGVFAVDAKGSGVLSFLNGEQFKTNSTVTEEQIFFLEALFSR